MYNGREYLQLNHLHPRTNLQRHSGMWRYNQTTGELTLVLGPGYSGHDEGRNNPAMQAVRSVGPIPTGLYQIGPGYDTKSMGPLAIPLTPVGHNALGRSGFFVHGDNKDHNASHGCIILSRSAREMITRLRDVMDSLEVVSGMEPEKGDG